MLERSRRKGLSEREIHKRIKIQNQDIEKLNSTNSEIVVVSKNDVNLLSVKSKNSSYKLSKSINAGIKIENRRNDIVIIIPKDFIGKINTYDLANQLNLLTSPIFFQKRENLESINYSVKKMQYSGLPHIAVFMNNVGHYSGGRYYSVMFCKLLASIGCKVTVITDAMPFFIDDFSEIDDGGNLNFKCNVDETIWGIKDDKNEFDLVIGVPNMAGVKGYYYAKKWNLPIYMMIFETPNYVSEYRGGLDSGEGYWDEYKRCLVQCDKIICLAKVPMEKAIEWLKDYGLKSDVFTYIYPAINTYVADLVPEQDERYEITFVGRHTNFKNPSHVVKALIKMKCRKPVVNFIGSHSEGIRINISEIARKNDIKIHFFAGVDDYEKFKIIKRSKVICVVSSFEGFGIVPAEALYCGKPMIAYDIPVLKDVYKDNIEYVSVGNIDTLTRKVERLLCDDEYRKERSTNGKKYITSICHPLVMRNNIRSVILDQKLLSISAGIIALNAEDTVEFSLKSIYNSVKEILVVEGAVKDYAKVNGNMLNSSGGSIDNTLSIIKNFPDPSNKIKILSCNRIYKNKSEMQNIIAKNITGDIYLKVDADEIYKESDIERIRGEFISDQSLVIFRYKFYHFWKNLKQHAVGGQWESKMTRCWRWNKNFRHPENDPVGFNYYFDEGDNKVEAPKYKTKETDDRLVYHLNYAVQKPEKIQAKIKYYMNRGIESDVKDTWTNWESGKSTSPTHKGGTIKIFEGELPKVLQFDRFKKIGNKINKEIEEKVDFNVTMMDSPSRKDIFVKQEVVWTIGMIVLNEEKFIKNNIKNLLKWDDLGRIVVVEGADLNYPKGNITSEGLSRDKTGQILVDFVNTNSKIFYIKKGFVNCKQELRNEYLKHAIGTHLIVIDADEFYSISDLNKLTKDVRQSPNEVIQWEFERDNLKSNVYGGIVHFWHSLRHRVVGGYYSIPHQRIYKIIDGMNYENSHNHPVVDGIRFDEMRDRWGKTNIRCYHAGFIKDIQNMRDKQDYYYNRGEKSDKPMYSLTREMWFDWDGKTMDFPDHKVKIVDYKGFIPDLLIECANV